MQTLTRADAEAWCKQHAVALDELGHPERPSRVREFEIPIDSGKRIYLVSAEVKSQVRAAEALVWFTEWGIWPSSERPHIFERFRASYGENRPLVEAPAHLFSSNELDDMLSFVTLGVLFLWDVYVISAGGDILHFSHDECGWTTHQTSP